MTQPTWGKILDDLADALRAHREDLHEMSDRPCDTCEKSAKALAAYEARRHLNG